MISRCSIRNGLSNGSWKNECGVGSAECGVALPATMRPAQRPEGTRIPHSALRTPHSLMPLRPDTPVQFLKGVGPRRAEALLRLGVRTVEDLLYHTPHRYLDATSVTPVARARVGGDVT